MRASILLLISIAIGLGNLRAQTDYPLFVDSLCQDWCIALGKSGSTRELDSMETALVETTTPYARLIVETLQELPSFLDSHFSESTELDFLIQNRMLLSCPEYWLYDSLREVAEGSHYISPSYFATKQFLIDIQQAKGDDFIQRYAADSLNIEATLDSMHNWRDSLLMHDSLLLIFYLAVPVKDELMYGSFSHWKTGQTIATFGIRWNREAEISLIRFSFPREVVPYMQGSGRVPPPPPPPPAPNR